jgi:hypothetical protein
MPLMHGKSKKAFEHNVETEMNAHPGRRAENLAIAYSVKRKAQKKKMAEGGMAKDPVTGVPYSKPRQGAKEPITGQPYEEKKRYARNPVTGESYAEGGMAYAEGERNWLEPSESRDKANEANRRARHATTNDYMAYGGSAGDEYSGTWMGQPDRPKKPTIDDDMDEYAEGGMAPTTEESLDMVERCLRKKMAQGGYAEGQDVHGKFMDRADMQPADYEEYPSDWSSADYTGENSGDYDDDDQENQDRADMVSRIMRKHKLSWRGVPREMHQR